MSAEAVTGVNPVTSVLSAHAAGWPAFAVSRRNDARFASLSLRSAAHAYQTFTRFSGARYSLSSGFTSNAAYQGSMLRTVSAR